MPAQNWTPRQMTETEHEAWARAIHRACSPGWLPAMRVAFAHLMPFVAEGCPTAFTDCQYRVGLSPELLDAEKTSDEKLAMVLIHETMHNTQKHRQRIIERRDIPGRVANFATDLEINSIIAEGILGIDLAKGPVPGNGHWDWLLGEVVELDGEKAEALNANINNPKKTYKAGDRFYQGGLLPRDGAFWDVPVNQTAEQYLSILDWDEVDFEMEIQVDTCPQCGQPMPGGSQNQQNQQNQSGQQGQQNQSDQQGQQNQAGQQGQDGNGSDSNGADGDQDGQSGSAGEQGMDGQGAGGNQAGQQGADGGNQGQNGADGQGGSGSGNGQGQDGNGNGTCPHCGQPLDQNGQCGGSGNGQGQGQGQGNGNGQGQGNGNGQGSAGTAKGTRTRIFQRHADGSVTELGEDAWIDEIDIDPQSDLWRQVGEMGINPITRGEEQHVREQLAHDIEEYRRTNQYGAGAGDMVLNYIQKGLRPPVVDWRSMLRRIVSRSCQETTRGREDFTWKRVSRRHSQGKFLSPGQQAYLPKIRFAIDTSGSMSAKEYEKALAEAEGVIRSSNRSEMECVSVDWDAYEIHKVRSVKEIARKLRGGGGTDMAAALKQVEDNKPKDRPDVLIIATDGCWHWESFAEELHNPALAKTAVVVLLVYKFDEDRYYAEQGSMAKYQQLLAKNKKNAYLVQAWV